MFVSATTTVLVLSLGVLPAEFNSERVVEQRERESVGVSSLLLNQIEHIYIISHWGFREQRK